jgi:Leucine-rich repeat (LRR) protein
MKNLVLLSMRGVGVSHLNTLSRLVHLEALYLDENKIQSLEPLRQLSSLYQLNVSSNDISDLTPLKDLK